MKNNFKAFTLVEIMLGVLIFTMVITAGFYALSAINYGKVKLIEETSITKEAFFFSQKLFEEVKMGGTLDYEEYFNRKTIGASSTISGHYLIPTGYGNFGQGGIVGSNTYGSGFYYCLSGSGISMGNKGCVSSYNTSRVSLVGKQQRFYEYSLQGIDYNSNKDSDNGDEDLDGSPTLLVGDGNTSTLDTGLVFHYDMDSTIDVGGKLVLRDLGPNGNNGKCYSGNTQITCGNSPGPIFSSITGSNGKSLSFDDSTKTTVVATSNSLDKTKPMTFFVRAQFKRQMEHQLIFINNNHSNCINRYLFYSTWRNDGVHNGSHGGTCNINGDWGFATGELKQYYYPNVWYNIVGIINPMSGYIKIYLDGNIIQQAATGDRWNFYGNADKISIGGDSVYGGGYSSDMYIDDFRLYNRVLTDDEITTLSE